MNTVLTQETASEYDFVIALDASGSMSYPSKRFEGRTRWQEAQEIIYGIASALSQYDSDGIDVVVFGAQVVVHRSCSPQKILEVFENTRPNGSTPLAEALQEIDKLNDDGKKAVALVFTDGIPNSEKSAADAIVAISQKQEKDEDFTLLFVQIGDDKEATEFLNRLDDNLTAAKFDIVDAITAAEAENYTPLDLINKAIND